MTENIRMSKDFDFLPTLFLHVNRTSIHIKEMRTFNLKDLIKFEDLVRDLKSDLNYHLHVGEKVKLEKLNSIIKELENLDRIEDYDLYKEKLHEMKAELILQAGKAGLIPTYIAGMKRERR